MRDDNFLGHDSPPLACFESVSPARANEYRAKRPAGEASIDRMEIPQVKLPTLSEWGGGQVADTLLKVAAPFLPPGTRA
jgi:hypothetical protein